MFPPHFKVNVSLSLFLSPLLLLSLKSMNISLGKDIIKKKYNHLTMIISNILIILKIKKYTISIYISMIDLGKYIFYSLFESGFK